ncbi:MAG: hypothetical protein WBA74_12490 [Cyclobacteriaceae bacterium]
MVAVCRVFSVIFLLVFIGSCSSDNEVTEQDFGYSYYPLSIGDYREYAVEEIVFLTMGPDTTRYFLREEVTDSLVSSDIATYIFERSVRSTSSDPWEIDSVWTTRITTGEAIQVENNVPIVKIQFPVVSDRTWDSNLFNTRDQAFYTSVLVPSDTLEDEVLKVIVADIPENIVLKDQRSEFYAKNIGLISRDFETLNFCTSGCEEVMEIESGRVLKQNLIDYGVK